MFPILTQVSSVPVVCVGEAVDTATRGTEAGGVEGPTRGT